MKILIAEDSTIERKILRNILEKEGHEVVESENGEAALNIFLKENIKVVITDWIMPKMSGVQLIEAIRDLKSSTSYTYILLLTSKDSKDQILVGLSAGADDYLTKPFDKDELVARLSICERILKYQERLSHMASFDTLTDLYSRSALYNQIEKEMERVRRLGHQISFVLADIDHFKSVNDKYGHLAGDMVLVHISKILNGNKRDYDFIGRWGGEEFLIVLPEASPDVALQAAERIRTLIESEYFVMPNGVDKINITMSFGISGGMTTGQNIEDKINEADSALYEAKREGRNRVCAYGKQVRS